VGFVFQHYALFPHLSVFENIAFGLRVRPRRVRPPEAEIRQRVQELLELVQLGAMANRRPAQLSGGQRQALTMLMATLVPPQLLLLDEHTAALDPKTARQILGLTDSIIAERRLTTLMVTHNMRQALRMGNRLIMLHRGRVILDIRAAEKKALTQEDLVARFYSIEKEDAVTDRMLFG
jgi:putative ABC transport system ATP-binding protein